MPKRFVSRITERRGPQAAGRHMALKSVLAVVIIGLGVAAFLEPTRAAVPSVRLAGSIMLAAGLFQVALALATHRHDPLARGLGIGVLNTAIGTLFVSAPQLSIKTLAFVLAIAQIVIGSDRCLAALHDRGAHWPWLMALGVLLAVSGAAIGLGWPVSGLVAIGRFVGTNMVAEGVTWLAILWKSLAQKELSVTLAPLEKSTFAGPNRGSR